MTKGHRDKGTGARSDLVPASALPLAYFALAHAGLAGAFGVLLVRPDLPGASFYHPRMVALVHLLTIAWLSGSILGAFYIVAPLALRLPMPAGRADWAGLASFVAGAIGMIAHFWLGTYDGMAWSAGLVTGAIAWVGWRAVRGMPQSPAPWPVTLHVALAFANILSAAVLGILIGLDRSRGFLGWNPLSATFAHAHLAAVGWAAMMVVGLSYRLIPMMLPAAMPTGRVLAASAVLMELGLIVVVVTLIGESAWLPAGAALILAGLASFVLQIRRTLKRRMPRPPKLPARDWSTWQTHTALLWLIVAAGLGVALSIGIPGPYRLTVMWVYGVAGLVGFLAQIVAGMQGRLVPLYAWYRAFAARNGAPPPLGANELPSAPFAKVVFVMWGAGVPLLAAGLASADANLIRGAAALLLAGLVAGAVYIGRTVRRANSGDEVAMGRESSLRDANPIDETRIPRMDANSFTGGESSQIHANQGHGTRMNANSRELGSRDANRRESTRIYSRDANWREWTRISRDANPGDSRRELPGTDEGRIIEWQPQDRPSRRPRRWRWIH